MDLPLQPAVPGPGRRVRPLLYLAVLVLAVLVLGLIQQQRHAPVRVLATGPGADQGQVHREVCRLIRSAQRRVWVMMYRAKAYDDGAVAAIYAELSAAAARPGMDVRVCLEHTPRQPDGYEVDNSAVAQQLRSAGVRVVIDEPGVTTHAKVLLVDDRVLAGSHNWTWYAMNRNRELSLLVDDPAAVREVEAIFAAIPGWHQAQALETKP